MSMETEIVEKKDIPKPRSGTSGYYPLMKKYEELPDNKVLKIKADSCKQSLNIYRMFKKHGIKTRRRAMNDSSQDSGIIYFVFAPKEKRS